VKTTGPPPISLDRVKKSVWLLEQMGRVRMGLRKQQVRHRREQESYAGNKTRTVLMPTSAPTMNAGSALPQPVFTEDH
jgi:hypothetical protein